MNVCVMYKCLELTRAWILQTSELPSLIYCRVCWEKKKKKRKEIKKKSKNNCYSFCFRLLNTKLRKGRETISEREVRLF